MYHFAAPGREPLFLFSLLFQHSLPRDILQIQTSTNKVKQHVSAGCSVVVKSNSSAAFVIGGTETLYLGNHARVGGVGGWQLNGNSVIDTMSNQSVQPITISNPGDPLASVMAPARGRS